MLNKQMLKKYCELDLSFKEIEKKSELISQYNEDKYLCVRLDGIGLSKKYLKNSMSNKRFNNLMIQSLYSTYGVLYKNFKDNIEKNIFLGFIICSDEVSIVLNPNEKQYERRTFKTVTTLASTFSSFFTMSGSQSINKDNKIKGAFDGRPIILNSLEQVSNYLIYRYAIFIRNSISKLLRIKGVCDEELYNELNYNNIDYYCLKIKELNLLNDVEKIFSLATLYIPTDSDKLDKYNFQTIDEFSKVVKNIYKEKV